MTPHPMLVVPCGRSRSFRDNPALTSTKTLTLHEQYSLYLLFISPVPAAIDSSCPSLSAQTVMLEAFQDPNPA